jgi:hypothetical protein
MTTCAPDVDARLQLALAATHMLPWILGIFIVVHLEFHEEALHRDERLVQTQEGCGRRDCD